MTRRRRQPRSGSQRKSERPMAVNARGRPRVRPLRL